MHEVEEEEEVVTGQGDSEVHTEFNATDSFMCRRFWVSNGFNRSWKNFSPQSAH